MFSQESWHGSDPYVEEDEPEWEDPDWKPKLTVRFPAVEPVAMYAYWWAYKNRPAPSFALAWNPQYLPLYNAAVGLAEIGVIEQIVKLKAMPDPISPRTVGPSPKDYNEMAAWMYGGIIGAAGAAASIIIRGAKGGAFQTAKYYGWSVRGRGPLWSVSVATAGQLALGFVPKGMEIVKEERFGFGRNARNQNAWADPGLG